MMTLGGKGIGRRFGAVRGTETPSETFMSKKWAGV